MMYDTDFTDKRSIPQIITVFLNEKQCKKSKTFTQVNRINMGDISSKLILRTLLCKQHSLHICK